MAMSNFTQPTANIPVNNTLISPRLPRMKPEQRQEVIVDIKDAFKIYREQNVETVALRGVDLQIRAGEFVALVGPSGSGKSTLLNLVGGIDTPSAGQVLVAGIDMAQLPEAPRALLRRRTLGFIFQEHNLIPFLTALENVLLPMQLASKKQCNQRAAELLTQVGLAERIHHRPDELSGGEQQRVSIACALANRPVLLLADEPTGELDSQTAQTIMELLTDLNQQNGVAILMVTHDLQMAAYSQRIIHLCDGTIMTEEASNG